ncbi:MAG: hypothetical protein B1H03_06070 [Planctomycetales bacterium 4484_113]|nr:MAG: hypothetical protein B1H03_06070 [Planctomycetales bacterium 4484_113]
MLVVHLQPEALMSLLLAGAEAFSHRYRHEMFAALLGVRADSEVWVESAQVFSTVDASNRQVWVEDRSWDAVESVLKELSSFKVVGECHSHPQAWKSDAEGRKERATARASRFDIRLWRSAEEEHPGQVYMIIAVNEGRSSIGFRYCNNSLELAGRLGKYDYHLAAYHFEGRRAVKANLVCPFALGLGK